MTDGSGRQVVPAEDDEVPRFIERFATWLSDAGMGRMPARVFVALLAENSGKLTAGELAGRLQVSPGAVSGAVRYLAQVNLIRKEREPGARRDHYVVHDDTWYQALTRRDEYVARWIDTIGDGIDALGPDTPAGRRLIETRAFLTFVQRKVPEMLKEWDEHRAELYAHWEREDAAVGGSAGEPGE